MYLCFSKLYFLYMLTYMLKISNESKQKINERKEKKSFSYCLLVSFKKIIKLAFFHWFKFGKLNIELKV